jgi:hypothetical protein
MAENVPLRRGITLLWDFSMNAGQPGIDYGRWVFRGAFNLSSGHIMNVDAIFLLAVGVVLVPGFATVAFQTGFGPGLGVVLICFGVMLIGTGIAYQIAKAPSRTGKPSFEDRAFNAAVEPKYEHPEWLQALW